MIAWIKGNKLVSLLIVLLLFFIGKDFFFNFFGVTTTQLKTPRTEPSYEKMADVEYGLAPQTTGLSLIPGREAAPTEGEDRLVVEESSMSLVVKSVREASDQIVDQAKSVGGYMVSTSLTAPEEAPFATVIVRVPSEDLRSVLDYCRSLAVKVTSEKILGRDVTDEYVDIEARLETLEKTKAKFEAIMERATEIQDILNVQRELIRIQDQIDNLKGRQKYLEQTAKLAKITVYLSTDEFALPYAPSETFRPGVIFKMAVRSLVRTLRSVAKALIWIGVYGVVWVPVGFVIYFGRRWWKKRKTPQTAK
jgi:hypothetical protein